MLLEELQLLQAKLHGEFDNWSIIKQAGTIFATMIEVESKYFQPLSDQEKELLDTIKTKCEELLIQYSTIFNEPEVKDFIIENINSIVHDAPDFDKSFAEQDLLNCYKQLTGVELELVGELVVNES